MPDKSKNHPWFFHTISWFIALLIIGLGIYLSHIQFLDSEWLSRAGCLVVMLGIWLSLGGIFQHRFLSHRNKRARRNALVRTKAELAEKDFKPEEIEKEIAMLEESFKKQYEMAAEKLKISFGYLEVSLLLTGTFLWGFGDLFFL